MSKKKSSSFDGSIPGRVEQTQSRVFSRAIKSERDSKHDLGRQFGALNTDTDESISHVGDVLSNQWKERVDNIEHIWSVILDTFDKLSDERKQEDQDVIDDLKNDLRRIRKFSQRADKTTWTEDGIRQLTRQARELRQKIGKAQLLIQSHRAIEVADESTSGRDDEAQTVEKKSRRTRSIGAAIKQTRKEISRLSRRAEELEGFISENEALQDSDFYDIVLDRWLGLVDSVTELGDQFHSKIVDADGESEATLRSELRKLDNRCSERARAILRFGKGLEKLGGEEKKTFVIATRAKKICEEKLGKILASSTLGERLSDINFQASRLLAKYISKKRRTKLSGSPETRELEAIDLLEQAEVISANFHSEVAKDFDAEFGQFSRLLDEFTKIPKSKIIQKLREVIKEERDSLSSVLKRLEGGESEGDSGEIEIVLKETEKQYLFVSSHIERIAREHETGLIDVAWRGMRGLLQIKRQELSAENKQKFDEIKAAFRETLDDVTRNIHDRDYLDKLLGEVHELKISTM